MSTRVSKGKLNELLALPMVSLVLSDLRTNLSPNLSYHNVSHTEEVITEAFHFGTVDGLSDRELLLLLLASLFHDSGFLIQASNHEQLGAERAEKEMRNSGAFTPEEIALVEGMILDTKLIAGPNGLMQKPNWPLSRYLLDADLGNFGRTDFFEKLEQARQEEQRANDEFLKATLALLESHRWLTPAAEKLRGPQKAKNLEKLREIVAQLP